jgi:hypothetical protein
MIVVAGNRFDKAVQCLVERWKSYGAVLLTSEDLSTPGWRHYPDAIERSCAVLGGRVIRVPEIACVLTIMNAVFEQELIQIVASDRAYVAAEITAFLRSWLSGLPCSVLNRPSATSLCGGPGWSREQWTIAAARLGIPVRQVQRRAILAGVASSCAEDADAVCVSVVGNHCFLPGLRAPDPWLACQALRLAQAAQVEFLAVQFSSPQQGSRFLSANLCPDASDAELTEAIRVHLLASRDGRL